MARRPRRLSSTGEVHRGSMCPRCMRRSSKNAEKTSYPCASVARPSLKLPASIVLWAGTVSARSRRYWLNIGDESLSNSDGLDWDFMRYALKLLSLIALICALGIFSPHFGGVWCLYVFMASCVGILILIIISFFARSKAPHPDGW
ncbi:hypothetical protein CCP4SC76_2490002 [Gammaproteobacteria bacterium]